MNATSLVATLALGALAAGAVPSPAVAATTHTVTDCGDTGGAGQLRSTIVAAAAGDTIEIAPCTVTLTVPDTRARAAGSSATAPSRSSTAR